MNLSFSGRRALVAGGSCDLALTLAGYMIRSGIVPVLTYRNEAGRERIARHLESHHGGYETALLDFFAPSSIDALFAGTLSDLDYVIDFAQSDLEGYIASANQDDVSRYIAGNISCRAHLLKEASRLMLAKKKGCLVFVSSAAALRPNPGQGFYAAAKLASEALYRNLGLELGRRGITTITIRPGYVDAGRGREFMEGREKEIMSMIPIARALTKEEVAETIMFFLSDSASGFNATEILMDGGLNAGK